MQSDGVMANLENALLEAKWKNHFFKYIDVGYSSSFDSQKSPIPEDGECDSSKSALWSDDYEIISSSEIEDDARLSEFDDDVVSFAGNGSEDDELSEKATTTIINSTAARLTNNENTPARPPIELINNASTFEVPSINDATAYHPAELEVISDGSAHPPHSEIDRRVSLSAVFVLPSVGHTSNTSSLTVHKGMALHSEPVTDLSSEGDKETIGDKSQNLDVSNTNNGPDAVVEEATAIHSNSSTTNNYMPNSSFASLEPVVEGDSSCNGSRQVIGDCLKKILLNKLAFTASPCIPPLKYSDSRKRECLVIADHDDSDDTSYMYCDNSREEVNFMCLRQDLVAPFPTKPHYYPSLSLDDIKVESDGGFTNNGVDIIPFADTSWFSKIEDFYEELPGHARPTITTLDYNLSLVQSY